MARKKQCPPRGAPGWIVTYSDLMSLLFTFFVLLFMMSTIDARKAESAAQSFSEVFGTVRNNVYVPFPVDVQQNTEARMKSNRNQTIQTIQNGNPSRSLVPIHKPKEKNVLGLVLFEDSSEKLSNSAIQSLEEIYQKLKGTPQMIEIRGHTGRSERGESRDQMDLAYARSYKVRQQLIDLGIHPSRIYIASWGSNRSSNTVVPSQVGVSNAYVEIFLISETPEVFDTQ